MVSRGVFGLVLALALLLFGSLWIWRDIPAATSAGDPVIAISLSDCGQGWTRPVPGVQTFQLHNTSTVTAEVDLIDPGPGEVYGEVEGIAAGTTRPMRVKLGNGTYAFRCTLEEVDPVVGPSVKIGGGRQRPGPGVVPVTNDDLLAPLKAYKAYLSTGLNTLVTETDALQSAVDSQDRGAGETAWLTAHLSYERLGAAYGAFGDADGAINGTADGLPGGTSDPGFTGFHRLENGLWHNEAMADLGPVAAGLDTAVHKLRDSLDDLQIEQNDLGLRAHEIMENALQFELTGHTDYGSGTNLATALANLDGTRAVLDVLRPLLAPRLPSLSEVDAAMNRADTALHSAQRPDGSWTPVSRLSREQHEKIDGSVSELTELLAPVAEVMQPRRTE